MKAVRYSVALGCSRIASALIARLCESERVDLISDVLKTFDRDALFEIQRRAAHLRFESVLTRKENSRMQTDQNKKTREWNVVVQKTKRSARKIVGRRLTYKAACEALNALEVQKAHNQIFGCGIYRGGGTK